MTTSISLSCPLLLGSQSPRRREILAGLGIPFVVRAATIDERVQPAEQLEDYLERVVRAKLMAVAEQMQSRGAAGAIAADTVVVLGSDILGKPNDTEDAVRLLELLSGRVHRVLTRFALLCATDATRIAVARTVESKVTMRAAARDELERYAATGEGLDKAGGYALQGCGAFLVERIDGSPSNVIGLPACEVVSELKSVGLLTAFPMVTA